MPKEKSARSGQDRKTQKMQKILEQNATTIAVKLAGLFTEFQKLLDAAKAHQKKVNSSKAGNKEEIQRRVQELEEMTRKRDRLVKMINDTLKQQEQVVKTILRGLR